MRESLMYGSVRGARGNSRPYRDEGASEAGAISRWKSGPGKAQQAAWKRVLRESDGNAGREAYTAVAWGV